MKAIPFLTIMILFLTHPARAQQWQEIYADRNTSSIDTATIKGKKYIGFLRGGSYFLCNAGGDTLLEHKGHYAFAEFRDYNKDNYRDILLRHAGNMTSVTDLFLFVPAAAAFREVLHFSDFPAVEPIPGSKYYFSYRKSGCGDMNWDSDLFLINDYTATRMGNIAGRQCNNHGEKDGLYIYRTTGDKKQLVNLLPSETIWKYKDARWGFIKEYWTKNYALFK